MPPPVNITMVTYNRLRLTRLCLESLLRHTPADVCIQVVDNGSTDGCREYLLARAAQDVRLRVHALPRNMGVSVAANLGWAACDADYYLKLDNDILIREPDWLDRLLALAERNPELGMLGYQFCSWHHTEQRVLPSGDIFVESDCCDGACVLIPRHSHERFGFWNEDYGRYGFEDLDYGGRVTLGGSRIGYVNAPGRVEHLGFAEGAVDEHLEQAKRDNIASEEQGKKLYVLNKLLFEQGIRPLHVSRKYLFLETGEGWRFRGNPEYRAILRLHAQYLPLIDFSEGPDGVHVDVLRARQQ